MKLKSAILDFLSSTAARQPRTDVVQFLRRYAEPSRHVTHYRAYGAQARNVKSFLDRLGLAEKSDYEIIRSEYDPETVQFRWNATKPVKDFIRLITSVARSAMEEFAIGVITGDPNTNRFVETIFVDDETSCSEEISVAEHPLPDFRACNTQLMVEFAQAVDADEYYGDSNCLLDNFNASFEGGWVILPPSVIESIVLVNEKRREKLVELFGEKLPYSSGIFQKTCFPKDSTGVRFLKKGERLVGYGRMFDSPFTDLMHYGSPMIGYLATNNAMTDMSTQAGKDFAFMRTDDWIGRDTGSVDWIMRNQGRFWKYVRCLYEVAYGTEAFVVPQSRLTMPNSAVVDMTYKRLFPMLERTPLGHNDITEYMEIDVNEVGWEPFGSPCAVLGVIIGSGAHEMLKAFPDLEKTEEKGPTIVNTFPKEEEANAFSDTNVDASDIPYEWFDMFHKANKSNPYANHLQRKENFLAFRAAKKALTPAKAMALSVFDPLNPIAESEGERYSPASAFVYSVVAAIRARTPNTDVEYVKAKPGTYSAECAKLHSDLDVMVTAVYTGVRTDKSMPTDTETFPALPTCTTAVCAGFTDEIRKTFTKAIDAIGKNGLQYKMAKRSPGTPRKSTVVIETNVDAKWFFENATDRDTMRNDIATSLLRTLCSRSTNPLNSTGDEERARGYQPYMFDCLRKAVELDEAGWTHEHSTNPPTRLRFSQIYGDSSTFVAPSLHWLATDREMSLAGIDVGYGVDESGRLFVIATVEGDVGTFARYLYRLDNMLPVKTAALRRRTEKANQYIKELSDDRIYINPSYYGNPASIRQVFSWYVKNHPAFEKGMGELPLNRHTFGPQIREPRFICPIASACPRSYYTEAVSVSL